MHMYKCVLYHGDVWSDRVVESSLLHVLWHEVALLLDDIQSQSLVLVSQVLFW